MKERPLSSSPSPFVFSGLRLESASIVIILTLAFQVALMIAFKDVEALLVILGSLVGAAAAELCFASPVLGIRGKSVKFSDGAAAISGLVTGFLLPQSLNPFLAGIASFFGLFVSRNFFNGKGNAWVNASAFSVIFAVISAPSCFDGATAFPPNVSLPEDGGFDYRITAALNRTVFRPLGIALPEGYVQLFFNPAAPVPAFKFGIVTLVSSIILIALDIIDWIAPAAFVAVYGAGVFFFSSFFAERSYPLYATSGGGNILFALFSSAVFFAAVYLLSDFPSLPRTRTGRAVLGAVAGVVAFFACGTGGRTVLGAVFAVFAANLLSLAIGHAEDKILRCHFAQRVLHERRD